MEKTAGRRVHWHVGQKQFLLANSMAVFGTRLILRSASAAAGPKHYPDRTIGYDIRICPSDPAANVVPPMAK